MRRFGLFAPLLLIAALAASGGVWRATLGDALDAAAEEGDRRLDAAVRRLDTQLALYRNLPHLIAEADGVAALLRGPDAGKTLRANLLLKRFADVTSAMDIYVMDRNGDTLAASNWLSDRPFVGRNFAFRPYFTRAMEGALGAYFALGTTSGARGFYFARPVADDQRTLGVVALKVDVDALERDWRTDPDALIFSDSDGVVFLSNRAALLYRALAPLAPARLAEIRASRRYADQVITPLPEMTPVAAFGRDVIHSPDEMDGALGAGDRWILRAAPAGDVGLQARIFVSAEPAFAEARAQALTTGAGVLALGLLALLIAQARAQMAERLEFETRAKHDLERRVEQRTSALTLANAQLEAEVTDRRAAEERLRRAQDDLVQARKLSALGQMSAGVSHELNQPLGAIRAFAENAAILLERGRAEEASANLCRIAGLTDRMARIIRNLRAFARKEVDAPVEIALDDAVDDALGLLAARIEAEGAEIVWRRGATPVRVRGGGVRVSQVALNVIANALDAMRCAPEKRIEIAVSEPEDAPGRGWLTIRDTGPGLDDEARDRMFDPFFTTKGVDEGEGLGLGLSISYGVVRGFGGDMRAANAPDGGAIFTVELPLADAREVYAEV